MREVDWNGVFRWAKVHIQSGLKRAQYQFASSRSRLNSRGLVSSQMNVNLYSEAGIRRLRSECNNRAVYNSNSRCSLSRSRMLLSFAVRLKLSEGDFQQLSSAALKMDNFPAADLQESSPLGLRDAREFCRRP